MKRSAWWLGVVLGMCAVSGVWGQTVAIQRSEQAIQALTDEILAIDGEIEGRVNRIVGMLSGVTDSTDSNRKVANQKEEAAQGLKKMIDWYVRERDKRLADLTAAYATESVEDLSSEIDALDGKIEVRIDQILEVSRSLARSQDVAKYEAFVYDDGPFAEVDYRVSDAYRHDRRIAGKTATAQGNVMQGLQAGIEELERTNDLLRRQIRAARNPQVRDALQEHLANNEALIERRRDQMAGVVSDASPAARTISSKEASSMDRLIQEMVGQIRDDFGRMERLVNQLRVERQRLKQLRLGARIQ